MGLIDRDYMHERRDPERPFYPPERTTRETLWHILIWVGLAFVVYQGALWWQLHRAPRSTASEAVAQPAAQAAPSARSHPNLTGNRDPNRIPSPPAPIARAATPSFQTVTRCVVNGVTTYSDHACAAAKGASPVAIDPSLNVVAGLTAAERAAAARPQVVVQVQQAEAPVVQNFVAAPVDRRRRCSELDEAIKSIDAQARQPLSSGEQDWLAAGRKEHRDDQFQIQC